MLGDTGLGNARCVEHSADDLSGIQTRNLRDTERSGGDLCGIQCGDVSREERFPGDDQAVLVVRDLGCGVGGDRSVTVDLGTQRLRQARYLGLSDSSVLGNMVISDGLIRDHLSGDPGTGEAQAAVGVLGQPLPGHIFRYLRPINGIIRQHCCDDRSFGDRMCLHRIGRCVQWDSRRQRFPSDHDFEKVGLREIQGPGKRHDSAQADAEFSLSHADVRVLLSPMWGPIVLLSVDMEDECECPRDRISLTIG